MSTIETQELEIQCGLVCGDPHYRLGVRNIIHQLVPAELLFTSPASRLAASSRFRDLLPFVQTSELTKAPCTLSLLLLCKYRQNASQFFYDMVSRWLFPHKKVNVDLFFASDVRLPELSDDLLSVAEIVVQIKSHQELEEVRRNIRQIETDIRLGVSSSYHAQRILEFKGLSQDGKIAMIQEKIGSLIQSRSKEADPGILTQMQHFLVTSCEDFKKQRDYHHISRIISNLYSFRKLMAQNIAVCALKRHVVLKLFKTRLVQSQKHVLGILAGFNFLSEYELFEQPHFTQALLASMPFARPVEGSFFIDRMREGAIQANYIEIEKSDGSEFTHEEIHQLRSQLPEEIQQHIEQLSHPIFMPRNEEEVLRNIMALSHQLRSMADLPQVTVSFEEQSAQDVCFTIVLVRATPSQSPSIGELFKLSRSPCEISIDRVRFLGSLGKKQLKEATVFRLRIASKPFLRPDRSVDLYQARQAIVHELVRILGEVRDFNGGMMNKQCELFDALKKELGRLADRYSLLLEKFFYHLHPIEMRSVMQIEPLKQFFLLLIQAHKQTKPWLFKREEKRIYALCASAPSHLRETIATSLSSLQLPTHQLISFSFELQENQSIGFLLQAEDERVQKLFLDAIESSVS